MEEGKGPTSQLYYTLRGNEKTQVHAHTFPVAGSPTARVDSSIHPQDRNTTRPQQDVSLVPATTGIDVTKGYLLWD